MARYGLFLQNTGICISSQNMALRAIQASLDDPPDQPFDLFISRQGRAGILTGWRVCLKVLEPKSVGGILTLDQIPADFGGEETCEVAPDLG
jgi:hypothetical protein